MKLDKVAIIGVGMIGGSIALSLKKKGTKSIVGYGRKKNNLNYAVKNKIIDSYSFEIDKVVEDADLVFICTPVCVIPELYKKAEPFLKKGCIVTDVGSTKSWIVREIEKRKNKDIFFVGSHPMTGSEKSSVKMAKEDLFEDAICVLAKTKYTEPFALETLTSLWESFKAKVVLMSPEEHDEIVAITSHLPHIMATTIIDFVKEKSIKEERILSLLAGGFRDTTRIASGDYEIWVDILKTNRLRISKTINAFINKLYLFKKMIDDENYDQIKKMFLETKSFRDLIPTKGKGAIKSINEIYIEVKNKPGTVGEITSKLGKNNINIVDIKLDTINKNRGILILTLESNDNLIKSIEILKKLGYSVKRKF